MMTIIIIIIIIIIISNIVIVAAVSRTVTLDGSNTSQVKSSSV